MGWRKCQSCRPALICYSYRYSCLLQLLYQFGLRRHLPLQAHSEGGQEATSMQRGHPGRPETVAFYAAEPRCPAAGNWWLVSWLKKHIPKSQPGPWVSLRAPGLAETWPLIPQERFPRRQCTGFRIIHAREISQPFMSPQRSQSSQGG